MQAFTFKGIPARVVFGSGTVRQVRAEVERLGARRALVLATPQQAAQAEAVGALIGDLSAGVFAEAAMHTPVETTERAMARVAEVRADCTVAVGGGSTTGLGKAIALRTDLPQLAVPTTYAGSEMTDILGQTEAGVKTTLRSPKVLPETVLYDVDLTLGLPRGLTGSSGVNAIAHSVEALYAGDCNPVIAVVAEEGIRALGRALPALMRAADDATARSDALYGAWLCGIALGGAAMALHHKLCHTLGGAFDLPHAETHTIVLPHAAAYNAGAAPAAMARIATALGATDGPRALYDLTRAIDAPRSLRELGMPESGIDRAAVLAVQSAYANPAPVTRDSIRGLIARAWAGEPPQ
ncbi:MAG: maleylacetate reductase [Alphaproteobacteria bacterium]